MNNYLEKLKSKLEKIPYNNIKTLKDMNTKIFLGESEKTRRYCLEDLSLFKDKGLDENLVFDLEDRIHALSEAQAEMEMLRDEYKQTGFVKNMQPARDLMNAIIRHYRFAYRDDEEMLALLRSMNPKAGYTDLPSNLTRLVLLSERNPECLKAINFDESLLDQALKAERELHEIMRRNVHAQADLEEAYEMRNRAYTWLKEAVDTIRTYGKYIFPQGHPRRLGYTSEYLRLKRRKATRELAQLKQAAELPAPVTEYQDHSRESNTESEKTTPSESTVKPQTKSSDEKQADKPKKLSRTQRKRLKKK